MPAVSKTAKNHIMLERQPFMFFPLSALRYSEAFRAVNQKACFAPLRLKEKEKSPKAKQIASGLFMFYGGQHVNDLRSDADARLKNGLRSGNGQNENNRMSKAGPDQIADAD